MTGTEATGAEASIGIITDSADTLVAFYVGVGFAVESTSEFPQGVVHRLRRDNARCKIFEPAEGPARRPRPDPWFSEAGLGYAALHVADVTSEATRFSELGGAVLTPPTDHRPGASYALVTDPEGNVWELLSET